MVYGKIKRKVKQYFYEVARLKKTPHEIALGFAIGVFVGILPTPGFNLLIGMLIILLYKNVNKLSLFGGMALFNPLTTPPIVYLSNKLGKLIVKPLNPSDPLYTLVREILHTTLRVLVGAILIALVVSGISYVAMKIIVKRWQKT
jgi:uncharacterized protein